MGKTTDPEDDPGSQEFEHRRVNAETAPPVSTTAANSVFALGGAAPPPAAGKLPGRRAEKHAGLIDFIRQQKGVTAVTLAKHLGITQRGATKRISKLLAHGEIVVVEKGSGGVPAQYAIAEHVASAQPTTRAAASFKAWLSKKGESSAEGRTRRAALGPREPATASRSAVSTAASMPLPAAAPPLTCGLLNTGELIIEAGEQRLRLDRGQMRTLVDYLDLVATALQAA